MSIFDKVDPKKIIREVEKKVNGFKHDIENKAKSGVRSVDNELNKAKGSIQWNLNKAKGEIEDQYKSSVGELEALSKALQDDLEDIPDIVKDTIEKAIKEITSATFQALMKVALQKALDVLKDDDLIVNRFGFTIDFNVFSSVLGGSISIGWGDLTSAKNTLIEKIELWAKKAPVNRSSMTEFIKAVAPDTWDVQVSAVTFGGDFDVMIDKVNKLLSMVGLPE